MKDINAEINHQDFAEKAYISGALVHITNKHSTEDKQSKQKPFEIYQPDWTKAKDRLRNILGLSAIELNLGQTDIIAGKDSNIIRLDNPSFDPKASDVAEKYLYYKVLDSAREQNGFLATSFIKTNEKGEAILTAEGKKQYHISFPGCDGTHESIKAAARVLVGQKNPHLESASNFIQNFTSQNDINAENSTINVGGHSLGAAAAIYASYLLRKKGLDTQCQAIDPFCAQGGIRSIIAKENEGKLPAEKIAKESLTKGVAVLVPEHKTLLTRQLQPIDGERNFELSQVASPLAIKGLFHAHFAGEVGTGLLVYSTFDKEKDSARMIKTSPVLKLISKKPKRTRFQSKNSKTAAHIPK